MGAGASNGGPQHHVNVGGLTGLTHGHNRHVTWSFYHRTGLHSVHLLHDGLTGKRVVTCDGIEIFSQKFNYGIFDTSSSHPFRLNLGPKAVGLITRDEASTLNAKLAKKDVEQLMTDGVGNGEALVTVNIDEKDTYFLYTVCINTLQYRIYQKMFWSQATMYVVDVLRKRRGREDGVGDRQHGVVVIFSRPPKTGTASTSEPLTFLVDGFVAEAIGEFGKGDAMSYRFSLEDGLEAVYSLVPSRAAKPAVVAVTADPMPTRTIFLNNRYFDATLCVNNEVVAAMARPPLLPAPTADAAPQGIKQAKPAEESKEQVDDEVDSALVKAAAALAMNQRNKSIEEC